jgi:hypothetical protein
MTLREVWERVLAAILPWPDPAERRAAIEEARKEAQEGRHGAAHAAVLATEITKMAKDNHFAEAVARQIMGGDRK